MTPLTARGGVFAPLRDKEYFQNKITVLNDTIAWSTDGDPANCIDIDPFEVYAVPVVADPLADVG